MKKVLIVSQYFHPENFRVNDIAIQLFNRGFDVTVLTGLPNYPKGKYFKGFNILSIKKEIYYQGVNIIRLPVFSRGKNKVSLFFNYLSFFLLGSFFSFFTSKNFDVVFTYGISPILQGSIANIYAKRKNIKSFLYLMDFWPHSIEAVDGLKNKFALRLVTLIAQRIYLQSDKILISSQGYQDDLIKLGVSQSKIYYWPQYHEDFYKPVQVNNTLTPEINPRKFNFIFTGNIGKAQDLDILFELIKVFRNRFYELNCNFNFIGDGRDKIKLEKFVTHHNLQDLIKFIETIDSKLIPYYLASSKVALLIIKDNSYLNKVLPAKVSTYVGCKIPIFAISSGPLADFIEKNNFGVATHSYDQEFIFKKIEQIVTNFDNFKKSIFFDKDSFNQEILLDQLVSLIK